MQITYRVYLSAKVRRFKSVELDLSLVQSSGAFSNPADKDLDGCSSCIGVSNGVVSFFFHTFLV
jgi:hypothetical protein